MSKTDIQIQEMQESIANILGDIETKIIESKTNEALELIRQTKKELVTDSQSENQLDLE